MLKKVLIIAFYFPPYPGAGSLRLGKFAKYLPYCGWEPLILTVDWSKRYPKMNPVEISESNIFRIPFNPWNYIVKDKIFLKEENLNGKNSLKSFWLKSFQKTIRLFSPVYRSPEFQMFFLNNREWHNGAFKKGLEIIQRHKPDLIFSSSPFHVIASKMAKITGIPWVAEFRDFWCYNPFYRKFLPLQLWEERLERKTIQNSAAVVAISKTMASYLEKFHHRPVFIIPNGFDEPDFMESVPLTSKFTLTIVGDIDSPWRVKTAFFEALGQLYNDGIISSMDFELRFVGLDIKEKIKGLVKKLGIEDLTIFQEWIPYKECIKKQKESSVLFSILSGDGPRELYMCPGKVYDYIAAGRPVLGMFPPDGDSSKILRETGCGVVANALPDIKKILFQWVTEFKKEGKIVSHYSPRPDIIRNYSRKYLTAKLAKIFEKSRKPS